MFRADRITPVAVPETKPVGPTPFQKFAALTKKVVAVPREEIQRREAEYKQARKARRTNNDGAKTH